MIDANAQYLIGRKYLTGEEAPLNHKEANKWFHLAAENGHVEAQFQLGISYEKGRGVEHDLVKALTWYNKAAEQGSLAAKNNLLVCYATAGVELDQEIAKLRKAIEIRISIRQD